LPKPSNNEENEKGETKMACYELVKVHRHSTEEIMDKVKASFEDVDTYPDGGLWIRARQGEVTKQLIEISLEYAGQTITAEHCMETERYDKVYKVEYYNGLCTIVDIRLNYCVMDFFVPDELSMEEISDQAIELLRKFDSVTKDGIGFDINNNEDKEIKVSFLHQGYKVEATKNGQMIEVTVLEQVVAWEKCKMPI
jgi:hypothetical protein